MIPVTRTALPPLDDYQPYLRRIWDSGQLTNNGPLCEELGDALRCRLGVERLELVANGTLALQLAIRALRLHGEIITTPFSYVATTNAILWEGCTPVFADIDDASFCLDPDCIEAAVTENTSAILATHVYGYPCDVVRIREIAERHGLRVIYDAAHAFGVRLGGSSLLAHGDCSTLSFHATKLFHTAEGGAIACRDPALAERIFLLKKFGHIGEDSYLDAGINAKMSELHAAMGLALLPQVDAIVAARRHVSGWYDERLDGCRLQRPRAVAGLEYNYAYYPVVFPDEAAMLRTRQALMDDGIGPRRYFHPSLNTLPFLDPALRRVCPVSESIAGRVLCLPLHGDLPEDDVVRISRIVARSLDGA